jgi:hypothetical protein
MAKAVLSGNLTGDGRNELDISGYTRSEFTLALYGTDWEDATVKLEVNAGDAGIFWATHETEQGEPLEFTADAAVHFKVVGDKISVSVSGVSVACDIDYALFH